MARRLQRDHQKNRNTGLLWLPMLAGGQMSGNAGSATAAHACSPPSISSAGMPAKCRACTARCESFPLLHTTYTGRPRSLHSAPSASPPCTACALDTAGSSPAGSGPPAVLQALAAAAELPGPGDTPVSGSTAAPAAPSMSWPTALSGHGACIPARVSLDPLRSSGAATSCPPAGSAAVDAAARTAGMWHRKSSGRLTSYGHESEPACAPRGTHAIR